MPNGFKVFKNPENVINFQQNMDSATIVLKPNIPAPQGIEISRLEIASKRHNKPIQRKPRVYTSSVTTETVFFEEPYEARVVKTAYGIMCFMHKPKGIISIDDSDIAYKFVGDPQEFSG